jgi:AraC-like DNA-binding protein
MFFHYKTPFTDAGGKKPKSYFCGQLTKYHEVVPAKNTGMLAVLFYPYAAKAFTHFPIEELTNKSVDLKIVYGPSVAAVERDIAAASTYEEKAGVVEKFLQAQFFISNKYQFGIIKQAVNYINDAKGLITVKEVAGLVFTGQRHFERVFKSMVGISPKMYAQIIKFYSALERMDSAERMTKVCFDFGYFDQSHFIKTFKRFTGLRPKDYFSHDCNSLEEIE